LLASSLRAAWEALQADDGAAAVRSGGPLGLDSSAAVGESEEEARFGPGPDAPLSANPRLLRRLVRNALFQRVELLARESDQRLGELDGAAGWDAERWAQAMAGYWDEYEDLGIGPEARSAALVQ